MWLLIASVVLGWPASWFLPAIEGMWYERILLWVSMLAISFTCADVLATTDVRAEQDGNGSEKPTA